MVMLFKGDGIGNRRSESTRVVKDRIFHKVIRDLPKIQHEKEQQQDH